MPAFFVPYNPKCAPARASILTGRYSWQLEEAVVHRPLMPEKWMFYPELLEASGYFGRDDGDQIAVGYPVRAIRTRARVCCRREGKVRFLMTGKGKIFRNPYLIDGFASDQNVASPL